MLWIFLKDMFIINGHNDSIKRNFAEMSYEQLLTELEELNKYYHQLDLFVMLQKIGMENYHDDIFDTLKEEIQAVQTELNNRSLGYSNNYDEDYDEEYDEEYDEVYDEDYDENYDEVYDEDYDEDYDADKQDNNTPGKHYVVSDIHGMFDSYCNAINLLNPNDTLYILGDVIDRGEDGIPILLDIMSRENVKFILGNHEWQMLEVLHLINQYNLDFNDLININKFVNISYTIDEDKEKLLEEKNSWETEEKYNKRIEEYKQSIIHLEEIQKEFLNNLKGIELTEDEMRLINIWMVNNSGDITMSYYFQLSPEEQEEIYNFLFNSMVIHTPTINDEKFCLVHASPIPQKQFLKCLEENNGSITYDYLYDNFSQSSIDYILHNFTEKRNFDDGFLFMKNHGYKTIYGHTPQEDYKINSNPNTNSVCIDTACCRAHGKLAFYCLEDDTVTYINPRQDPDFLDPDTDDDFDR